MLSRPFTVCATTAKEFLVPNRGLKKFTRLGVPHTRSDPQKVTRVEASNELLQILNDLEVILLIELQQATSYGFIIFMSRRLCLRSRQVMSFQEREQNWV
jgi:hypothetical protein